jgi:hypothetical protein
LLIITIQIEEKEVRQEKSHEVFRTSRAESDFATATSELPDLDIYQGYEDFAVQTSRKKTKEISEGHVIISALE